MHYLVEVGIPASGIGFIDGERREYRDVLERINSDISLIMRKYDESLSRYGMKEYGMEPSYTEEYDGDSDGLAYNPEGLWDWYEIGGRWKTNKIPDKGPYISKDFDDWKPYNSLHASRLHDGCQLPCHKITGDEPGDMKSIEIHHIDEKLKDTSFKQYLDDVFDKTGEYEDYIWTSVDIHN